MAVNISATFKKDEKPRNGLAAIAEQLVDEDLLHAQYVVVATIRPKRVAMDAEDGVKTPTIRFDHIEVLTDVADVELAKGLLARRLKDRTGIEDTEPASLFDVVPGDEDNGERQVPEAGADEIMAERAERKAAEAEAEQANRVAPPAFSGGEPE
ncbi:hypothetical protein ACWD6N_03635 [Micromonospora sp. NPDC005163]